MYVDRFDEAVTLNECCAAPQVRTSAIPKAARRKDWLRPLWLLGMILYMCAATVIFPLDCKLTVVMQSLAAHWQYPCARVYACRCASYDPSRPQLLTLHRIRRTIGIHVSHLQLSIR